jgi:hypothetical protein
MENKKENGFRTDSAMTPERVKSLSSSSGTFTTVAVPTLKMVVSMLKIERLRIATTSKKLSEAY